MNRNCILILVFLAAACSSESGLNPTVAAVFAVVKSGVSKMRQETTSAPPSGTRRLTRAMIDKAGIAMIRAQLGADAPANHLVAATKHGPYVTYFTRQGQQITLAGSAITATRGIGHDLLSVSNSPNDPLVRATAPAKWPASLKRAYYFYGDGPAGRSMVFDCKIVATGSGSITIVEIRHHTVRFLETCTNAHINFENIHFADARNGFVWRSRQWVSPDLPQIDFDVLEPFTGK